MDTLRTYLDTMFASLPKRAEVLRARDELYDMMEDKYEELRAAGKNEHEAVGAVISEFGDIAEIREALGIGAESDKDTQDTKAFDAASASSEENGYGAQTVFAGIGGVIEQTLDLAKQGLAAARQHIAPDTEYDSPDGGEVQVVPAFEAIRADTFTAGIVAEEGDDYTVTVTGNPEVRVEVTQDGTLVIEEDAEKRQWFHNGPVRTGFGSGALIRITCPASLRLRQAGLKAYVGNVFVSRMQADVLEIEALAGSIVIDTVEADMLKSDCKAGNIRVKDSSFGEVLLDAMAGEIRLENVKSSTCDMKAAAGNIRCEGGALGTLSAKSSAGNIRLDGSGFDCALLKAGVGNVKCRLPEAPETYELDLRTTHGHIKCYKEQHDSRLQTQGGEGKIRLEAKSSLGNIVITGA